jgi:hypothetical protein
LLQNNNYVSIETDADTLLGSSQRKKNSTIRENFLASRGHQNNQQTDGAIADTVFIDKETSEGLESNSKRPYNLHYTTSMQKSSSTRPIKFIESDLEALEKKRKREEMQRTCPLVNLRAHVRLQL